MRAKERALAAHYENYLKLLNQGLSPHEATFEMEQYLHPIQASRLKELIGEKERQGPAARGRVGG